MPWARSMALANMRPCGKSSGQLAHISQLIRSICSSVSAWGAAGCSVRASNQCVNPTINLSASSYATQPPSRHVPEPQPTRSRIGAANQTCDIFPMRSRAPKLFVTSTRSGVFTLASSRAADTGGSCSANATHRPGAGCSVRAASCGGLAARRSICAYSRPRARGAFPRPVAARRYSSISSLIAAASASRVSLLMLKIPFCSFARAAWLPTDALVWWSAIRRLAAAETPERAGLPAIPRGRCPWPASGGRRNTGRSRWLAV